MSSLTTYMSSQRHVFLLAVLLRAGFLVYGLLQDAFSPMKYTDIDYFVFTDAARFVSQGKSPYDRDTYRYTPILAWLLVPTSWGGLWFSFGKVIFALSDVVAGWLSILILRKHYHMSNERAVKYSCIWLLNPMVATISTRGSSEGLLGVIVLALLWAVLERKIIFGGMLLGFGVHFKIYPFIYATSILWWLGHQHSMTLPSSEARMSKLWNALVASVTPERLLFAFVSSCFFIGLNVWMSLLYGQSYIQHSWLYHFTRLDHRHNFSPYNLVLYLNSSPAAKSTWHLESLAFLPQILLSALLIPITLSRKDLGSAMLAQTFAFVTLNKVCTSQYFLWYLMFLPFYLPSSTLLRSPRVGLCALCLWVAGQVVWLQQGYQLEFLGRSSFLPGLWLSSLFFYLVNCWILGIIITDIRGVSRSNDSGNKTKT